MKQLLIVSTLALSLTGCIWGEEHEDLQEWMAAEKASMQGKVEPLPGLKPYEPFVYSAETLLAPFDKRKMDVTGNAPGVASSNRPREVLEGFDLEKLRMVGTLQKGRVIFGLIRDPNGNLHRVRVGSFMGQNFGRITAVSETEIRLLELIGDSSGDWKEKITTLPLDEVEQTK